MTSFFKKINVSINYKINEITGPIRFKLDNSFKEYDLALDISSLIRHFEDQIEFGILPDRTSVTKITNNGIRPHTDAWLVSMNFYLSLAGGVTTFYKLKSGSTETIKPAKVNYDINELVPVQKLEPKLNECYLFNTGIPHSVTINHQDQTRYIFRFIWSYPITFDTVYNSIKINNDVAS